MSLRSLELLRSLQAQQQVDTRPADEDGALRAVRTYWEQIGREQPFWGVLTHPEYADCGAGDLPSAVESSFAYQHYSRLLNRAEPDTLELVSATIQWPTRHVYQNSVSAAQPTLNQKHLRLRQRLQKRLTAPAA